MRIPKSLSTTDAATLGVGVSTVGQGLYQSLGFSLPDAPSKDNSLVLIYGGSTATGSLAIQYAKL
jgi:NADPH:quinone reductase-like Zn-dependent oxidoreductase